MRNLGVPDVPRVGRGAQVLYTARHLVELALALELVQACIDPAQIAELMQRLRPNLRRQAEVVFGAPEEADYHLGVVMTNLGGGAGARLSIIVELFPRDQFFEKAFDSAWQRAGRRLLVIRFGAVLWELRRLIRGLDRP